MALLTQPLDLHQLESCIFTCCLKLVRPPAHEHGRPERRPAVHDRARAPCRALRDEPRLAQDAGEREVHAPEAPDRAALLEHRRVPERVDQLVGALVALAPFADAAVDDLLQMVAAREPADLRRADADVRVALHEHAEQLADLVDVVARLPLRHRAREDVARRGHRVHGARRDAAAVALVAHDAEVAELEAGAVADEHVHRSEVAVQHLSAMQLPQHLQDAGDLGARALLGPALRGADQVVAKIAMPRVLESQAIEHPPLRRQQRERVEDADGARMPLEELPEIGLAQPAVTARADLDAQDRVHLRRGTLRSRQVDLPESADTQQALDRVAVSCFGTRDDLASPEQARTDPCATSRATQCLRRDGGQVPRHDGDITGFGRTEDEARLAHGILAGVPPPPNSHGP